MFISLASRFIANVEALNAVESVGNVTKHRRAPVVVFDKVTGSYTIRYVPAISGESIAHAYQSNLAEFARGIYPEKVPLCKWCARGEFLKEMSLDYAVEEAEKVFKSEKMKNIEDKKHEFEKAVVKACLVEDVGGFLFAEERLPVKRSSVFQVGYVIPTLDTLEATVMDTQFHVRHAPVIAGVGRPEEVKEGERAPAAQMIYYVEVASAFYGLHMNLDLDAIGRTRLVRVEDVVDHEERKRRVLAALGGLALTVAGHFGAKRSRFNPISELRSVLVSVSKPHAFSVTPPHNINYINSTAERASSFTSMLKDLGIEMDVKLFAYNVETSERVKNVQYFNNAESLFNAVIKHVTGSSS